MSIYCLTLRNTGLKTVRPNTSSYSECRRCLFFFRQTQKTKPLCFIMLDLDSLPLLKSTAAISVRAKDDCLLNLDDNTSQRRNMTSILSSQAHQRHKDKAALVHLLKETMEIQATGTMRIKRLLNNLCQCVFPLKI